MGEGLVNSTSVQIWTVHIILAKKQFCNLAPTSLGEGLEGKDDCYPALNISLTSYQNNFLQLDPFHLHEEGVGQHDVHAFAHFMQFQARIFA